MSGHRAQPTAPSMLPANEAVAFEDWEALWYCAGDVHGAAGLTDFVGACTIDDGEPGPRQPGDPCVAWRREVEVIAARTIGSHRRTKRNLALK